MIDWVDCVMRFPHERPICGGRAWLLDLDASGGGEPVWNLDGECYFRRATTQKRAQARGSWDATCSIQSSTAHNPGTTICISGSPKFLQGHNLFGSDDPRVLAAHMARRALETFGLDVDRWTMDSWLSGRGIKFARVDVTQMLDVGDEFTAGEWLRAAADCSTLKHRGRGRQDHGTVYFGKNSRRWALKLYRKFVELESRSKAHRLPDDFPNRARLLEYARGTIRAELVFRSLELKRLGLHRGDAWANIEPLELWSSYMSKLELSGNLPISALDVESLPSYLRSTYLLWEQGRDVRAILPRPTYYRHRAELRVIGIDIATPTNKVGNVVPLVRVVEARPKGIPDWARGTPLLYAA